MKVNLYIYIDEIAHKLESFKDEQISVTSTAKNLSDITKIYADYSKTFTIPASKTNNQILSHWYENAVEDGFDQRIKAKGYIEIDTITFREGLWQIEAASVKENKIQSYSLTFFGELKTLVDIIGENEIRDLDFTDIITSFGAEDVVSLVKGDSPTAPVLFPLIANEKKWFFSLSSTDDKNIRQDNTINKFNLPPAVSVDKIFDAIETDFGLTFSGSFLNSERFKRLYLYFKNEEEYVTLLKPKRIDFSTASGSGTTPIIFTENDDFFEYKSFEVDAYESQVVLNIEPQDFLTIPYYVSVFRVSTSGFVSNILNFNGLGNQSFTIIQEDTPALEPAGSGTIGIGTGNNEGVYFIQISSETGNNFEGTLVYTGQTLAGTAINKTILIPLQSIAESYDFNKIAPRIKIIDFLSGLIKMFNLTIIPLSETSYRFETLDTFYQLGKIINLTKYSDTSNKIERIKVYNEINFQYQKSGTIVNTKFRDLMTRDYDYGDLNASFDGDGGKFSVELPFETLLFNELKYISGESTISTNILMGFNITPDEKPYKNKPILLYRDSVKTASDEFSFGLSNIETYVAFGNQTTIGTEIFSLNFGIENTINTNQPIFNSLYKNFYSSYLENIFNKKARIIKIKMRLPLSILTQLKLNDRIILRDKRYLINNFTNELTTGETTFELAQDLRSLILFQGSTKLTPEAQTKVLDATGLPDDVTFVAIIDNFSTLLFEPEKNTITITVTENTSADARIDEYKIVQDGLGIQSFYVIQQGAI
jgi:hypothetical protein